MSIRTRVEQILRWDGVYTASKDILDNESAESEHRQIVSAVFSQVDSRLQNPTNVPLESLQPWQIKEELKARQDRIYEEQLVCGALQKRLREVTPYSGPTRSQLPEK